ncbi:MAG: phospholipid carrier-dependent glycosyltransferase [Thermoplasmatota archaeon]
MKRWIPFVLVCLFAASSLLTDLNRVGMQWDESYYVTAAKQFHDGTWTDPCWDENDDLYPRPVNYEHPPLAKLIISLSTKIAGDDGGFEGCRSDDNRHYKAFLKDQDDANRVSWRLPAALLSLAGVVFVGLAAGRLLGGPVPATIAAGVMSFDLLYLGQARVAILDPYAAAFLALALYAATFASWKGTWATIILLSLGFASKYTAAFAGPPLLFLHLVLLYRAGELTRRRFDLSLLTFALVPIGILALTYIPWWILWIPDMGLFGAISHWVKVLAVSVAWGTAGEAPHADASGPWSWLIVAKPVWYYTQHRVGGDPNMEWYIYAIANPFIMWTGIGSIGYALARYKDKLSLAIGLLPLATFAVFLFISRATFIFYAVVLSPLFALSIAHMFTRMWASDNVWQRMAVLVLGAFIVAGFTWYKPLIFGEAMTLEGKEALFDILPWMDP